MHNQRGGTLGFVVAGSLVITIFSLGVFWLIEIVGGGRELQHANDAGNLNLAKNALVTPFVTLLPTDTDQSQFIAPDPAINIDNRVNLNNVNRVFAHTLLVEANAKAMIEELSSTASGNANTINNAQKVKQQSDKIGAELSKQLASKENLQEFFLNLTNGNSIRMLLSNDQNKSEISQPIHDIAYTARQFASNIDIIDEQIPATIRANYQSNLKNNWTIPVNLGNSGRDNVRHYLKGYNDSVQFSSDIGDIHFVPLKNRTADENQNENVSRFVNSQPHLIARRTFEEQKSPSSGNHSFNWSTAIPNSFLSQGNTKDFHSSTILGLSSCAISQSLLPNIGYTAAIHRGYVRIKNTPGITLNQEFSIGHAGDKDVKSVLMDQYESAGHELYWTFTNPNDPHKYFFEVGGTNNINKLHNWAINHNGSFPASAAARLLPPTGKSNDNWEHCAAEQLTHNNVDAAIAKYPNLKTALELVLGIDFSIHTTKIGVKSTHAVEAGNLELLSQRSNGADDVHLHTWRSGVALHYQRGFKLPFPKFRYTPNLGQSENEGSRQYSIDSLLPNTGNSVHIRERIAQRCKEIDPNFQSNQLSNLLSECSLSLREDGSNQAYIFFDDAIGHLVVRNSNNLPTWLQALAFDGGKEIPVDGIPATWDIRKSGNLIRNSINRPGDWGFLSPYDYYPDHAYLYELYTFTPCTGFRGLLGEVIMEAAFCSQDKPNASGDNAYSGHGVKAPILCPGNGSSFTSCPGCDYSGPC